VISGTTPASCLQHAGLVQVLKDLGEIERVAISRLEQVDLIEGLLP
jgi:hypothetical protein